MNPCNIGALVFALAYPRGVTSMLTNLSYGQSRSSCSTRTRRTRDTKWTRRIQGQAPLIDGRLVGGVSGGLLFVRVAEQEGRDCVLRICLEPRELGISGVCFRLFPLRQCCGKTIRQKHLFHRFQLTSHFRQLLVGGNYIQT